jgi:hypothetical protein
MSVPKHSTDLIFNKSVQSQYVRQDSTLTPEERETHWQLLMGLAGSHACEHEDEAEALLFEIRDHALRLDLYTVGFIELFEATLCAHFLYKFPRTEYSAYPKFQEELSQLIPGAHIVDAPFRHQQKPDFFIEREGMISPVEIKLRNFTNHHVKQLRRYMTLYNCQTGYAVAPKLTGKLLPGMMFITWSSRSS